MVEDGLVDSRSEPLWDSFGGMWGGEWGDAAGGWGNVWCQEKMQGLEKNWV